MLPAFALTTIAGLLLYLALRPLPPRMRVPGVVTKRRLLAALGALLWIGGAAAAVQTRGLGIGLTTQLMAGTGVICLIALIGPLVTRKVAP